MKDTETTHRASPLGKKVDDGMTPNFVVLPFVHFFER